ncbi:MAG: hypothetical protein HXX18_13660 [Bacteroidetes bacterium]|nr:hypothetical protein [Bacteroidota bacterium]
MTYSQNVAIELEKMNVFYKSIANPIKVVVQNYPCEKLILKSKYGIISQADDSCHYFYRTDSCNAYNEKIYVGVELEDKVKWLDTLEYRLKKIPDPFVSVANISTCGIIDRNRLWVAGGLVANIENFDIDVAFRVLQYSVVIYRNDSVIFKADNVIGNRFSTELISEIKKAMTNDRYLFDDVIIETFDKCSPKLSGPEIKIK